VASPLTVQAFALVPAPAVFGGAVGGPVQAPTFAFPATDENEALALVGTNRGTPGTTSNDAEVP